MFFFTIRRVIASVFVLLASSFLVFALCAASFDPLSKYYTQNPRPPESFFDNLREQLGLNDNFFVRYWNWLSGALTGNFGETINGTPVSEQLGGRLLVTGRMILLAIIIAVILAVVVGVIGAVRQYKPSDYAFTFLAYLLIALPTFWFAALLKEFVAGGINDAFGKQVLYTLGEESPGIGSYGTTSEIFWDRLGHLVLPTICLAVFNIAFFSRYQRSAMLDVLGSDFLRTARAKGLRRRQALMKHGVRTALIPMATFFAYTFGLLVVGATFTETLFGWNGMGKYLIEAINSRDINAVSATTAFIAVLVLLSGMLSDIVYAALDPRVRAG